MPYPISKIWRRKQPDLKMGLERCLTEALASAGKQDPIPVFFRADDVAMPGRQFAELIHVFASHGVPLSMSVVPSWLTRARWKGVKRLCQKKTKLWCFYQHGWRHMNHETAGKNLEFGPARSVFAIEQDLLHGRERLTNLMGVSFYPAFTPPWNRCSKETLVALKTLGFRAISRSRGASPIACQSSGFPGKCGFAYPQGPFGIPGMGQSLC